MVTRQELQEARQNIQKQKSEISQRRKEAEKARKQLEKEEKKLPKVSQRRLRGGLYSGLEGRKRRRLISQAKGEIKERKRNIKSFKKGLKEFEEKELKQRESQITETEKQLERRDKLVSAIKEIAKKGGSAGGNLDPIRDKYGRDIFKEANEYFEAHKTRDVDDFQVPEIDLPQTSTSPVNIVDGKVAQFTPDPSQFKKIGSTPSGGGIWTTGKQTRLPKSFNFKPPRDLGRTDIIKEFKPFRTSFKDVGSVSKGALNMLKKPFLTTGSPKRFTPLTNLKPKRPPTPSKPLGVRKTKQPKVRSSLKLKPKKGKQYKDLFFGDNKKKKGKKSSIWGF